MSDRRLGFIGLGVMGGPMARNLLRAGYQMTVYDLRPEAMQPLVGEGATPARSSRQVAEQSDVVITVLPDSPDVELAVLGRDGVRDGIREGALFIDMSTISPATALLVHERLAERGVQVLDAPVSGGEIGAKEGTLSIMVGGDEQAFERALPILRVLGKRIVRIGGPGAGQIAKICNQILVGVTLVGVAEALTLARKAGVDVAKVREALLGGFAQSRVLEVHGQRLLDRRFEPGFRVRLHRKDLALAQEAGRLHQVPLFATSLVAEMMDALLARGKGELDHAALALLMEELAGLGE
ncbi:MAG: 2-hydroxy-3-oxopropionate reductase [candidate division KSB1 bacterium]|nr:2-hydroxy-3-oxopropionate reductase [candidate division KSB1 bacterium]